MIAFKAMKTKKKWLIHSPEATNCRLPMLYEVASPLPSSKINLVALTNLEDHWNINLNLIKLQRRRQFKVEQNLGHNDFHSQHCVLVAKTDPRTSCKSKLEMQPRDSFEKFTRKRQISIGMDVFHFVGFKPFG
jgi:hypothetical protein